MYILNYYKALFASKHLTLEVINDFTLSIYFALGGSVWDFEDSAIILLNIFIPSFVAETYINQTNAWEN